MSQIKAGVVFCTKFVTSSEKAYSGYVRYIDREEATRNEAFQKYSAFQFSGYNDYMGNPEKTTALFTSNQDSLSDMGIERFLYYRSKKRKPHVAAYYQL